MKSIAAWERDDLDVVEGASPAPEEELVSQKAT